MLYGIEPGAVVWRVWRIGDETIRVFVFDVGFADVVCGGIDGQWFDAEAGAATAAGASACDMRNAELSARVL